MAEEGNKDIPEMNLNNNYSNRPNIPNPNEAQKELDKTKKELNKLKTFIIKKYPFTEAIGLLPPQSLKFFIEEEIGENLPKEEFEKLQKKVHLMMLVPNDKAKEIPKIKSEVLKEIEKEKHNVWIYIKTPSEVWEYGLDSKFELLSAVSMSFPLHDNNLLKALRVAEIHKTLVLQKFERYVVSYVIGGSLVTGSAVKTSDLDTFIIINDTDVKRMPRLELRERLRGIILGQYLSEAHAIAGVKENMIHVQIYLLTDFWQSVKDAEPVIFTFIRDGIPIYDRGTFMPWKTLLRMGKLKPSPESIDMFMSMGDQTIKRAKNALLDILIHDIYWGIITPSQALLMLYGQPPAAARQTVREMKEIFVEKEKMLEPKYLAILEKIVEKYKEFEHEKLKEIKGEVIDEMLNGIEEYLKRLKELRKQIEKKAQGKTIEEVYEQVTGLLKIVTGKNSSQSMIEEFTRMSKEGKFSSQDIKVIKDIINARGEFKKGKTSLHEIDKVRKEATSLINEMIEYSQRKDLAELDKRRMILRYKEKDKEKTAEILICDKEAFLFIDGKVKKLTDKIQDSDMEEVSKAMESQKAKKNANISSEIFFLLKKELGEFEIVL
ncbi:MAG: nucleotidyltransferase domain-containing protein [Nanoarchaeota archaeon]|nr:nucleotidyltransferase domain-containing protein [Nanoarchaeota archaeon]